MSNFQLSCNHLSKAYGNQKALEDVTFGLTKGKIVGLLGPNGSGKTTLIKIANGLLVPSSGEILIDGQKPSASTKAIVSYLPDTAALPNWMSTVELIDFYGGFYKDFDKEKAFQMVANLSIDKNAKFKSLSKGTKEKVQLILTMSRNAKLYLLDEPMGGVDPATRDYILNTIISGYNENSTVVISTHLIADIEKVLDEVIFIDKGRVVLTSTVDDIRNEKNMSVDALFREVFKC